MASRSVRLLLFAIAVELFALVFAQSSTGVGLVVFGLGVIGFVAALVGLVAKDESPG